MWKIEKSSVANIRQMLLMKDRSFLYELRPYLIYVKAGEKISSERRSSGNKEHMKETKIADSVLLSLFLLSLMFVWFICHIVI